MRLKGIAGRRRQKDDSNMLGSKDFEHYFQALLKRIPHDKKEKFEIFYSLWFSIYAENVRRNDVISWVRKKEKVMEKQYLIVPIVLWSHWRLLIISGIGKESDNDSRCIIVLDSMQSLEQGIESTIRSFVWDILKAFGRSENKHSINVIPLLKPSVPQQLGNEECGWYVLMFAKLFVENIPEHFSISKGFPYFMVANWFSMEDVKELELFVKRLNENNEQEQEVEGHMSATEAMIEVSNFSWVEDDIRGDSSGMNHEFDGDIVQAKGLDYTQQKDDADEDCVKEDCVKAACLMQQEVDEEDQINDDVDEEEFSKDEHFNDSDYEIEDDQQDAVIEEFMDIGMADFEKNVKLEVNRQTEMGVGEGTSRIDDEHVPYANLPTNPQGDSAIKEGLTHSQTEVDRGITHGKEKAVNEKAMIKFDVPRRGGIKGPHGSYLADLDVADFEEVFKDNVARNFDIDVHSMSENSDDAYNDSHSSSSEDESKTNVRWQRFIVERDMVDPKFDLGTLFGTRDDVKKAIINHAVKLGRKIYFEKNDNVRVVAKCKDKQCNWHVIAHVVRNSTTFQIKKIHSVHACSRSMDTKIASARYIAKRYLDYFRIEGGFNVYEFQARVHRELNININLKKVYNIKAAAKILIEGKYKEQYKLLWDYIAEVKRSNPNSTIFLDSMLNEAGKMEFRRFYVCLHALRTGFLHGCRRIIGLDGTFLKGPHPGILLTAVGVDANNGVYPVVYAVVEGENKATWKWFVEYLIQDLEIYRPEDWCIISDRQKGLIPAVSELLPGIEHRHYVRHLHNNFKKNNPGQALKEIMWSAAKCTYPNKFYELMERMNTFDPRAHEWLQTQTSPNHWSRSHFKTNVKCDILLNNHCKTFNRQILSARTKPILGLLERVRVFLMLRLQGRREWIERQTGTLCPRIAKRVEKLKDLSAMCIPFYAGGHKYEVQEGSGGEQFAVDLELKACSCRKWELCGIPCIHGVAAIGLQEGKVEDYVDECYSIAAYKRAHTAVVSPCNGPNNIALVLHEKGDSILIWKLLSTSSSWI